jgi:hypothetical protein
MAGSATLVRMTAMTGLAGLSPDAAGGVGPASGEGALVLEGVAGSGSALGVTAAVLVRGSAALPAALA